jgi:hypothetical protein
MTLFASLAYLSSEDHNPAARTVFFASITAGIIRLLNSSPSGGLTTENENDFERKTRLHRIHRRSSQFTANQFHAKRLPDPMTPQKLVVLTISLTGGAIGLFAPVGFVKWLLQTEPEEAGILTLFFLPVWCLLVVLGLLIGRRLGLLVTGKRVLQR